MTHFFGQVEERTNPVIRLGSKTSGIIATVASWEGAITIELYHDPSTGHDWARIETTRWHGSTNHPRQLYHGPIDPDLSDHVDSSQDPTSDPTQEHDHRHLPERHP